MHLKKIVLSTCILLISLKAASQADLRRMTDTSAITVSLRVLPQNFYINQLGIACKAEWKLQKISSLPLFIRLGSKDYVDFLESKGAAYKLSHEGAKTERFTKQ
jgi:hypothetical protein